MARTNRIDASLLDGFWSVVNAAPLALRHSDWSLIAAALRLSVRLDHPICDCLCLALAFDRGAALATADRRFIRIVTCAAALPPDCPLAPP